MLQAYSYSYERLREFCNGPGLSPETLLRCVQEAAAYAAGHHPGRFADGTIENIALQIGRTLPAGRSAQDQPGPLAGHGKRRVLHVSPFVWRVGGHTRTLQNWIALDSTSEHSVALIHSCDPSLVPGFEADVHRSGGTFNVLHNETTLVGKARALRALAQSADLVVLHHTCNDVVPVAAFATDDGPPVAFVNDCDQAYWLGSTVADLIINQRAAGGRLNATRRFVSIDAVLPIPLAVPPVVTREAARTTLGIPADRLVVLSVGRAIKYRPTHTHDFFATVRKVLDRTEAHLYVVGLSENDATRWQIDWRHPRIHLCGTNPDPSLHRAAADLYLESMPFGSATALLETVLTGVPAVLPFDPPNELFVTNHGLETIVTNPATEAEYVDRVCSLLDDPADRRRLADALRDHVLCHHAGAGWAAQVQDVYRQAEAIAHRPRQIPETALADTPLDYTLSEWQASLNQDASGTGASDLILRAAYQARWRGDHRVAFELLRRYRSVFGLDARLLRAAGELPAHKVYSWFKRSA